MIIKANKGTQHTKLPILIYVRSKKEHQHSRNSFSPSVRLSNVLPHIHKAVESWRTNENSGL